MPTVYTVLGAVQTADLGFTLSHEYMGTNTAGLCPMQLHTPGRSPMMMRKAI
jgi:predicted metal-dependent phosphotriesterase family hydrolase